jgi:hypothetical protein
MGEAEPAKGETENPAEAAVRRIVAKLDADIIILSGRLYEPRDETFIAMVDDRKHRRTNVMLVLTTLGGDPDVAYKMARALQHSYKHFTVFVPGYCKSAGTLIVLGAHEIVMAAHAELGPLDTQVLDRVETDRRGSALTLGTSLISLESKIRAAYKACFADLRDEIRMSTKLAAQTATMLVTRMYAPLLSQIDPMMVGEFDRANMTMIRYGERLTKRSKNVVDEDALFNLVNSFPSHSFVIDKHEAKDIFKKVRAPTKDEYLFTAARKWLAGSLCFYWDDEEDEEEDRTKKGTENVEPSPSGSTAPAGGETGQADGSAQRN